MRRAGFTLIELLVVIAIVAVLAAILFSVFSGVKERARRTVCQSNLKQLTLAMQQYVQDNGGVYPPLVSEHRNANGTPAKAVNWNDQIYPYVGTRSVFYCPSAPADAPAHAPGVNLESWDFVDYNYNWFGFIKIHRGVTRAVAEGAISAPSTTVLYTELNWVTPDGVGHYVRDVHTSCGDDAAGMTLHSGAANYAFADGHVKWLTPEEIGEVYCLNGPPKSVLE